MTYYFVYVIIHLTINLNVNCLKFVLNTVVLRGYKMIQKTLLALCDPTRREILKMLKNGGKTAGEISERFDISPPAISRHLAVLREAELVESRREGKFIFYESNQDPLIDLDDWIRNLLKEND